MMVVKEEEEEKPPKQQQQQVMAKTKKRKKPKEVAIFGNYRHYYGYRITQGMDVDPRLKELKKEWFQGKDCLDIGCNEGLVTIEIAKSFHCRSICGVDIDTNLVENAYWNLNRIAKMESTSSLPLKASEVKLSDRTPSSEDTVAEFVDEKENDLPDSLLERVSFMKENFVERLCKHSEEKYDAILCLSVTKWIHLNWGDDGVITLFSNIWRLLRPGGIFVLEPQPWKSYTKNYQVSETTALNYHSLAIYPCDFQELLLDKIGFRTVESITSSLPGSAAGFNRPLFAFRK